MVSFSRVSDKKSICWEESADVEGENFSFILGGLLNRKGSLINFFPLYFLFSPRIHQPAIKIRHLEPWKIALIVIGTAVAAAVTIGLLVYFLAYGKFYITCNIT